MTTQATVNWGLKFMDADSTCGVTAGVAVDVGPGGYTAISAALAAALPLGDTPTELAIDSAVAYLQSRTDPNSKYILLATDGLPNCKRPAPRTSLPTTRPARMAAVEAASTAGFDTFVVGIATGRRHGQRSPSMRWPSRAASPSRPAPTPSYYLVTDTATLEAALTTIAASATPCSFALPAATRRQHAGDLRPPPAAGASRLPKDPANGWAYAADMKSVALNGTACASVQSGAYASIVASYLCAP